jgi:hypothetical protein
LQDTKKSISGLGVDFFNNLFAIIITNKKRCKNSKERRNFI